MVDDRVTGLHFAPGNSSDLAAKVSWAWTHPQALAEMGRAARRTYETRYTPAENYQSLMNIYACAIDTHVTRTQRRQLPAAA
jgi:glycosyltransferase involved in cell wall biosynthesis